MKRRKLKKETTVRHRVDRDLCIELASLENTLLKKTTLK